MASSRIGNLRLKVAVNAFKRALLPGSHIPGQAQTTEVFEEIFSLPEDLLPTERTWESWFSRFTTTPKIGSTSRLDTLARHAGISYSDAEPRFYEKLIHGGLISEIVSQDAGRDPRLTFLARAEKYQPASPLHLHLDAIELGTLTKNLQEAERREVLAICASRILNLVFERWAPHGGTVYSSFPSSLCVTWESADQSQHAEIENSYARWGRALLERDLISSTQPRWSELNIDVDIDLPPQHVHKLLLRMVPDSQFLQGERLKAWALDLATAGLAINGLALSDRSKPLSAKITIEQTIWAAIAKVFFTEDVLNEEEPEIFNAMEHLYGEFSASHLETLVLGRHEYQSQMADLGLSACDVFKLN